MCRQTMFLTSPLRSPFVKNTESLYICSSCRPFRHCSYFVRLSKTVHVIHRPQCSPAMLCVRILPLIRGQLLHQSHFWVVSRAFFPPIAFALRISDLLTYRLVSPITLFSRGLGYLPCWPAVWFDQSHCFHVASVCLLCCLSLPLSLLTFECVF